jgi:hypothetical protein
MAGRAPTELKSMNSPLYLDVFHGHKKTHPSRLEITI